jgi:hypothetical protein
MNNPNYAKRFQVLGRSYLAGGEETFDRLFGEDLPRLEFEHQFLIEHLCRGFRADLCAWDWTKTFKPLENGEQMKVSVFARRGWQPTGLTLIAGETYEYRAEGAWQLSQNAKPVTAAGDQRGAGRLVGTALKGLSFVGSLQLDVDGSFKADTSGNLYLRCREDWSQLSNNSGSVQVQLQKASQ